MKQMWPFTTAGKEKAAKDKKESEEKFEKARKAKEKLEQEKIAKEKKVEQEKIAKEKKIEQEKIAKEKKIIQDKKDKEDKEEREKKAKEKLEQEKIAKEKKELLRIENRSKSLEKLKSLIKEEKWEESKTLRLEIYTNSSIGNERNELEPFRQQIDTALREKENKRIKDLEDIKEKVWKNLILTKKFDDAFALCKISSNKGYESGVEARIKGTWIAKLVYLVENDNLLEACECIDEICRKVKFKSKSSLSPLYAKQGLYYRKLGKSAESEYAYKKSDQLAMEK